MESNILAFKDRQALVFGAWPSMERLARLIRHQPGLVAGDYLNIRPSLLNPRLLAEIAGALAALLPASATMVAGPASGALPLITALGLRTGRHGLVVRPDADGIGPDAHIDGLTPCHGIVALVDDIATTGGSLLRCAELLRWRGAAITQAIVVIDEECGVRKALAAVGIELRALLTRKELGV